MTRSRTRKVLRDLAADPAKNAMLVLSISLGVFALGTILGAYSVLTRTMAQNYLGTKPAAATLRVAETKPIERALVEQVERLPGVARADRRATVMARVRVGDAWMPMLLFVIDDFEDIRTNTVRKLEGAFPPPTGTILLERTALDVLHVKRGSSLLVRAPHAEPKSVRISGIVHDPGLAPAWQEKEGYGYLTMDTLRGLGESQGFDELRLLLDDGEASRDAIDATAQAVAAFVTKRGYPVHEIEVPPPRFHPHQGQMNAVLSLFVVFGFLCLVLAAVLVASSIDALMAKQVREIGIMKTVGASTRQIGALYVGLVMVLSIAAVALGWPLSRLSAGVLIDAISQLLNLEVSDRSIPVWVAFVQGVAGLAIPLAAVALPVWRGSRVTVQQALGGHGVTAERAEGAIQRVLTRLRLGNETLTLALRNTLRRRARTLLTIGLLAAGGATFMAALDLATMWRVRLEEVTLYRRDDVELTLTEPLRDPASVRSRLAALPGVASTETWTVVPTALTRPGEVPIVRTYPDRGHAAFNMVAVPEATRLLAPFPVLAGRWLHGAAVDENEVVLNQLARAQAPWVTVGNWVELSTDGRSARFRVVGFVQDIGTPAATAYVGAATYARAVDARGPNELRISFVDRRSPGGRALTERMENLLERDGIRIATTRPILELRSAIGDHMRVLISALLALAVLTGLIGALGLTSTMSVNVMERTRELGVLRAIGATPTRIASLVVSEGMAIGVLSLGLAWLLSLPLAMAIGSLVGRMAFRAPLELAISLPGVLGWSLIVLVGAALATLYPALRASRLTTRDALAYE